TFELVLNSGPAKTRTGVQCLPASVLRDTNMLLKSVVLALRMPASPEAKTEYTLWLTGSATIGPLMLLNVPLPVVGPPPPVVLLTAVDVRPALAERCTRIRAEAFEPW